MTDEHIERAAKDAGFPMWKVEQIRDAANDDSHSHRLDVARSILAHAETLAASEARQAEQAATIARLREALGKLHHAVCGETGFAQAVRTDSGKAYPWPALDIAEEAARTALEDQHG